MQCPECGGEMKPRYQYTWDDPYLGKFSLEVQLGEYWGCAECKDEILSYSLMKKIESEEQKRTEQLLLYRVGCDYAKFKAGLITNRELVQVLGKTRQAIQQDRRIKTLIFHVREKSGQILYWRESAEQYKNAGDGRFVLFVKPEKEKMDVAPKTFELKFMSEELTSLLNGNGPSQWNHSDAGLSSVPDKQSQYVFSQSEKTIRSEKWQMIN